MPRLALLLAALWLAAPATAQDLGPAWQALEAGDPSAARAVAEAAHAVATDAGTRWQAALMLARIDHVAGEDAAALARLRVVVDEGRRLWPADPAQMVEPLLMLGYALAATGEPAPGLAASAEAVRLARRTDDPGLLTAALDALVRDLLNTGDPAAAEALAAELVILSAGDGAEPGDPARGPMAPAPGALSARLLQAIARADLGQPEAALAAVLPLLPFEAGDPSMPGADLPVAPGAMVRQRDAPGPDARGAQEGGPGPSAPWDGFAARVAALAGDDPEGDALALWADLAARLEDLAAGQDDPAALARWLAAAPGHARAEAGAAERAMQAVAEAMAAREHGGVPAFDAALRGRLDDLAPGDAMVRAADLALLAATLAEGRPDLAALWAERVAAVPAPVLAAQPQDMLPPLRAVAEWLHSEGRLPQALHLAEAVAVLSPLREGPGSGAVARALLLLAAVQTDMGRLAEAGTALDLLEGAGHAPDIAVALRLERAALHARAGQGAAAEAALLAALSLLETTPEGARPAAWLRVLGDLSAHQAATDPVAALASAERLATELARRAAPAADRAEAARLLALRRAGAVPVVPPGPVMAQGMAGAVPASGQGSTVAPAPPAAGEGVAPGGPGLAPSVAELAAAAQALRAQGQLVAATAQMEAALAQVPPDHPMRAALLAGRGLMRLEAGQVQAALDDLRPATAELSQPDRRDEGFSGQALAIHVAAAMAAAGTAEGTAALNLMTEAFQVAQRVNGLRAGEVLGRATARLYGGDALGRAREAAAAELAAAQAAMVQALAAQRDAGAERARLTRARAALAGAEAQLAERFPDYGGFAAARPVDLLSAAALLRADEVLVLFATVEGDAVPGRVFAVTQEDFASAELPPRAQVAALARALRCAAALTDPACVAGGEAGTRGAGERGEAAVADGPGAAGARGDGVTADGPGAAGLRGAGAGRDGGPAEGRGAAGGPGTRGAFSLEEEDTAFDPAPALEAWATLLAPVAGVLEGKRHLIVVPDRAMVALPFHLMARGVQGGRIDWLIRSHALTVMPNVAGLARLRDGAARPVAADRPFLGIGDPLIGAARGGPLPYDCGTPPQALAGLSLAALSRGAGGLADPARIADLPALPDTRCELEAAARLYGTPEALVLQAEATETRLKALSGTGALAGYRVLSFATHGLIAGEMGAGDAALVLTPPAVASAADDGLLTAAEIALLRLDAELVILSACNTAAGTAGGEGLSGLASGFFLAGARSLLVSHWPVWSDAATRLTSAMLAEAAHAPRAEALRRAMLALADDPAADARQRHPAWWGAFMLVGEGG